MYTRPLARASGIGGSTIRRAGGSFSIGTTAAGPRTSRADWAEAVVAVMIKAPERASKGRSHGIPFRPHLRRQREGYGVHRAKGAAFAPRRRLGDPDGVDRRQQRDACIQRLQRDKAAVRNFARSWVLAPRAIRVNVLSPGSTSTAGWHGLASSEGENLTLRSVSDYGLREDPLICDPACSPAMVAHCADRPALRSIRTRCGRACLSCCATGGSCPAAR